MWPNDFRMCMNRTEEIIEHAARAWPDKPAIIDRLRTTTYGELASLAWEVRDTLCRHVAPGALVGISLLDAREFLATLFGIVSARCIAIPISPALPAAEQARVISETGVAWSIVRHCANVESSEHYSFEDLRLRDLVLVPHSQKSASIQNRVFPDAAVLRHTSGTTAFSRGVVLTHQAVFERTEASGRLLKVSADDKVLAPLPLPYHFVASALSFLRAGATIIDCASLTPPEILRLGAAHGATIMYASPMQYELISRTELSDTLTALRTAISTSSLLSPLIAGRFQERFGVRLTQVYGVIEVGLPIWNSDPSSPPTALGRCAPPYSAEVRDDNGIPVSDGVIGELFVKGPGLFAGYLTGEDSSVSVSPDSWFATGDLVSRDTTGLITFKGRRKSVINSGGNKVFPEEVEAVLRRAPEISEVRVSAEPHPILGHLVIAEVVVKEGVPHNIQGWRTLCYSELSGFKVPKDFRVVKELPQTGSGKLVRHSVQRARQVVA